MFEWVLRLDSSATHIHNQPLYMYINGYGWKPFGMWYFFLCFIHEGTKNFFHIVKTNCIMSKECDDDSQTIVFSVFLPRKADKIKCLLRIKPMTVSGHTTISQHTAGLFNFPSGGKLQTERFSLFEWQLKTACDHFFIITTAQILRAAKDQLDSMAASDEGASHTETEGHEMEGI